MRLTWGRRRRDSALMSLDGFLKKNENHRGKLRSHEGGILLALMKGPKNQKKKTKKKTKSCKIAFWLEEKGGPWVQLALLQRFLDAPGEYSNFNWHFCQI